MNPKYNFKKKYITEGFDFDSLDNNDNDSIISNNTNDSINDLIESRRSVLNVANKLLGTTAAASFKSEYIPELKTPVLYKSIKNPHMGNYRKVVWLIKQVENWYSIKNEHEWNAISLIFHKNIKNPNRELAETVHPWFANNDEYDDYADDIINGTQKYIDMANIMGYNFFNTITSYLQQHGTKTFDFIELYISYDGGMFALSISYTYCNGYKSDLLDEPNLLILGFTNNVKYNEAYLKTSKNKRAEIVKTAKFNI